MKEIIELAKQAGMNYRELEDEFFSKNADGVDIEELERFAKLVAKKQAEKCAFLCDELYRKGGWDHNAGFAADCIRKRFLNDDS